jgi:hypothetical protein
LVALAFFFRRAFAKVCLPSGYPLEGQIASRETLPLPVSLLLIRACLQER